MSFADGLYKGAQTGYRWVDAYRKGVEMADDAYIKDAYEGAGKVLADAESAINAEEGLSDYDRMQKINEARGNYWDTMQRAYLSRGRETEFNNAITADSARRAAHIDDLAKQRQEYEYKRAGEINERKLLSQYNSLFDAAGKGDPKANAAIQQFGKSAGVNIFQQNGQWMLQHPGADKPIVMDMKQGFQYFKDSIAETQRNMQFLQELGLLQGDMSKAIAYGNYEDGLKTSAVNRAHKVEDTRRLHNVNKDFETPDVVHTAVGTHTVNPYDKSISNAVDTRGYPVPKHIAGIAKENPELAQQELAAFYAKAEPYLAQLAGTAQENAKLVLGENDQLLVEITDPDTGKPVIDPKTQRPATIPVTQLEKLKKNRPDLFKASSASTQAIATEPKNPEEAKELAERRANVLKVGTAQLKEDAARREKLKKQHEATLKALQQRRGVIQDN